MRDVTRVSEEQRVVHDAPVRWPEFLRADETIRWELHRDHEALVKIRTVGGNIHWLRQLDNKIGFPQLPVVVEDRRCRQERRVAFRRAARRPSPDGLDLNGRKAPFAGKMTVSCYWLPGRHEP